MQLSTAGQTDAGDVAPGIDAASKPSECLATDIVDRTGEPCGLERPLAVIDLAAQQHLRCAETSQVFTRFGFTRYGDDFVPATRQHVDRHAAHAARCTGDHDRSFSRSLTIVLHAMNSQCCGEAGRAERHRFVRIETGRHWNNPLAIEAGKLGVAAIVHFRKTATGNEYMIARLIARICRRFDYAGQVHSADQRELAQNRPCTRCRQRILVVDVGIQHAYDDIAWGQIVE